MDQNHKYHIIKETIAEIPFGKVATIEEMAEGLELSEDDILWAVKEITDNMIPTHRLVRDDGTLLGETALFTIDTQRDMLDSEHVVFSDDTKVDLSQSFWSTCEYVKQTS